MTDLRSWGRAASAAGLAWLATFCVASVCLLAPKLQYPAFARGADPVEVFSAVVIVALGVFRVPVSIGGLTITVLPFGALLAAGISIAWAAASSYRPVPTFRLALIRGIQIAIVFAVAAFILALVFRLRGRDPVAADAASALVWTFGWACLFATGGLIRPPREWPRVILARIARGAAGGEPGIWSGVAMSLLALVLAAAALLVWIIVGLARGDLAPSFGWADVAAAALYLVAFLPNLLTALVALSVGAPVLEGAQVGFAGDRLGGLRELSLLDWPGGAPLLVYALLVIPIIACTLGGWLLRRATPGRSEAWRPLAVAAVTFAAFFAVTAWLGDARVGAGLVRTRGLARVAVLPVPTFLWCLLWSSVFGWLGVELASRRSQG